MPFTIRVNGFQVRSIILEAIKVMSVKLLKDVGRSKLRGMQALILGELQKKETTQKHYTTRTKTQNLNFSSIVI